MRAILLHSRETWFKAVRKALRDPPDPPGEADLGECLIVFASVEEGDTPDTVERLAREAVEQARRVGVDCILVYPFAHLSSSLAPPPEAHRLLVLLEKAIRSIWDGRVERAPFGWYKAFRVHCVGHPLCELSREYRGSEPLYKHGDSAPQPLAEAVKAGLAPPLDSGPWPRETGEVLARFGLDPLTIQGFEVALGALWHAAGECPSQTSSIREAPRPDTHRRLWLALLRSCLDFLEAKDETLLYNTGRGGLVLARRKPWSPESLSNLQPRLAESVRAIRVSSKPPSGGGLAVPWYADYSGELYYYSTPGGRAVSIAARVEGLGRDAYCIGPSVNLASMLVDHALTLARGGWTPHLPFWASPVHAAVIPVRDSHVSFAESVAHELASRGLRVYLDPPTRGLGARVRAAGRLWTLYVIVIGDREVESRTVSVRRRVEGDQVTLTVDELVDDIMRRALAPPSPLLPRAPPLPHL